MAANPLDFLGELAKDSVTLTASSIATSVRMAGKSEELLEEAILTLRAARPVIHALSDAIENGLLEDVKTLLSTASETQEDVRAARESMERVVSLVNTGLEGVGGVPGAQLILKGIARVASSTKTAIPVVVAAEADRPEPSVSATRKRTDPKKV